MTFKVRATDLAKLNSLTKYPSIPTYHTLDAKNGGLLEDAVAFDGAVIGTEKVDGTNSRIVVTPDGEYVIGSREELLYARGDLIGNPVLGIADALRALAERLCLSAQDEITVFYLEVFGGKVTAASKQYTSEQRVAYRMFDVVRLKDYVSLLAMSSAHIAAWRDSGGQAFVNEDALQALAAQHEIPLTPRLFTLDGAALPQGIVEMRAFLQEHLSATLCRLDDSASGKPEGIVLRAADRACLAKARFEDYERTLKRRK